MKPLSLVAAGLALFAAPAETAAADPLVFQGQNAALFSGANPNDTNALMTGVSKPAAPVSSPLNVSQLVQESVISQISNNLYSQISGTPSGKATLGDGSSFSWSTDGGSKSIVYTAPNGGVTTITIPSL